MQNSVKVCPLYLFCSVICIFISTSTLQAQVFSGMGVRMAGVWANQTWEYSNPEIGEIEGDYLFGIQTGLTAEMFRFGFIASQFEISYMQKGRQDREIYTDVYGEKESEKTFTNRLHFLSLQAGEKLILPGMLIRPFVHLALRYDILLGIDAANGYDLVYDKYGQNSYGLTLGGGIELAGFLPLTLIIEG